jgi:hypothetical protein
MQTVLNALNVDIVAEGAADVSRLRAAIRAVPGFTARVAAGSALAVPTQAEEALVTR